VTVRASFNNMHPNSRILFELYAAPLITAGAKVLEIGPDKIPTTLQDIAHGPHVEWHLLDLYKSPAVQICAVSEYEYPVADESYDVALAANVLEHVRKPWVWIREVARVVRRGGYVITINPVSWPYHEQPIDCWRAYPEGMKALFDEAGIQTVINRCESHEPIISKRDIPGRSIVAYGLKRRLIDRALGMIGYPQERAYDTISVGIVRKAKGRSKIQNIAMMQNNAR
jgi:SAM-dependent methyltransferase